MFDLKRLKNTHALCASSSQYRHKPPHSALGRRSVGASERRSVGASERRSVGASERRSVTDSLRVGSPARVESLVVTERRGAKVVSGFRGLPETHGWRNVEARESSGAVSAPMSHRDMALCAPLALGGGTPPLLCRAWFSGVPFSRNDEVRGKQAELAECLYGKSASSAKSAVKPARFLTVDFADDADFSAQPIASTARSLVTTTRRLIKSLTTLRSARHSGLLRRGGGPSFLRRGVLWGASCPLRDRREPLFRRRDVLRHRGEALLHPRDALRHRRGSNSRDREPHLPRREALRRGRDVLCATEKLSVTQRLFPISTLRKNRPALLNAALSAQQPTKKHQLLWQQT